ncbi:MAG: TRCF domain-containing protein, partial [Balneolaceae bacterium]
FINELGFEIYTKILDDAVRELKEQEFSGLFEHEQPKRNYPETQVEFDASALLETDYVADNVERLNLYRKLAEAETMEQIDAWQEELTDRFGQLPEAGMNLMTAAKIKLAASRLYLTKVTIRAGRMWLSFPANKSQRGEEFYQSGLFQKILERVTAISGEEFKLIQKKEAVRLVIQEIDGIGDALAFIQQIVETELVPSEEVTA